jgi:gliding-associated putative ABC transporter substrate-binding component GldG
MATTIAVVFAIVVVVSLLSVNYFVRADLTEKREFTITPSSKALLRGLTDIVNVDVYLSSDLPQHMTGFRTRLEDVLDEYGAYGGENVRIAYTDPTSDPELEREVQMMGVRPVQLQALERDRAEVVNAYMGLTVMYEDRREVIPFLLSLERLEYDLTSAILKVTTRERPVVAFLTGHGEKTIGENYRSIAEELRRNYDVREVDLALEPDALADVTTLVVAGALHVPDAELFAIDQFVMRGGRAVFLLDGADVPMAGLQATPTEGNIFDFVSSYGATVDSDLVIDRVNSNASFQMGYMTMSMPYPYWPKATAPNVSAESPVTSELDAIPFTWTSSITITDPLPEGVEAVVLARSSGYSWTVPAYADLNPQQRFAPTGEDAEEILEGRGQGHVLAAALGGEFASAFEGKPVIVEAEGQRPVMTEPEDRVDRSVGSQIILFGNSRMFDDALLRQLPGNLVLFLNAVDWLSLGDTLIGIRSKAVQDRPLDEITDARKAAVKFAATFGVPIALVAAALVRALARRRKRALAVRAAA